MSHLLTPEKSRALFDRSKGKNTLPGADYRGWKSAAMKGSAGGARWFNRIVVEIHSNEGLIMPL
jgi:hypothetical protein